MLNRGFTTTSVPTPAQLHTKQHSFRNSSVTPAKSETMIATDVNTIRYSCSCRHMAHLQRNGRATTSHPGRGASISPVGQAWLFVRAVLSSTRARTLILIGTEGDGAGDLYATCLLRLIECTYLYGSNSPECVAMGAAPEVVKHIYLVYEACAA